MATCPPPGPGTASPVPIILFLAGVGRFRAAAAAPPLSGASAPLPAPAASTRWVRGEPREGGLGPGPGVPAVTPRRSRAVRQRGGHGGDTGADPGAERGHDVEQAPHGRRYPPPAGPGGRWGHAAVPPGWRRHSEHPQPCPLLSSQGTAGVRTRGWAVSWRTQGGCPLGVALPHPLHTSCHRCRRGHRRGPARVRVPGSAPGQGRV